MQNLSWWQSAVVYQIYPRSFQDTDGDGIGDLNGILQRLDYLVRLGVDAIWISPIYPSPMADFGYDVADYCGIDPLFGSLQDFDRLLKEIHARGLKCILDFVPNHTSDQHPWFRESRSTRDNPRHDWYLWRDEPNNWLSNFGGSGWEWDKTVGQYYYHSFLEQQPDLNWRNPEVRQAMRDALRFWLELGVDGFRVDVMWLLIKDDQYRDNPPNPSYQPGQPSSHRLLPVYNSNRPEVHEVVTGMRGVLEEYGNRVLIGEIYLPISQLVTYYGDDLKGANLPFNFELLQCPWTVKAVASVISEYEAALPPGAWPNWVLGNHDNKRLATRVGKQQARVAAMLLFTLPGTLTVYYGEELGMENVPIPPELIQDPAEKNEPGLGLGRDPERTPMPWDSSPLAGFTTGTPWLPPGSDHLVLNVATQELDGSSMLHYYRTLIAIRKHHSTLVTGAVRAITTEDNLLRYERIRQDEHLLVLLNMGDTTVETAAEKGIALLSSGMDRNGQEVSDRIQVRGGEGLIIAIA